MPSRKLLGFLVSHRGIKVNPDKILVIKQMQAPKRVKDVQWLNGCITALGRFISRLAERALPFFKLLKKSGPIEWTPKAEAALQSLKEYLASPPILVAPCSREPLLLYIAATMQVVRGALVVERDQVEALDGPPFGTCDQSESSSTAEARGDNALAKTMVQRPV